MVGKCFWSEMPLSPGSISACVTLSRGMVRCFCLRGRPGIGKTRLVLAAGARGRELGLVTLSGRGSELERDFAYGLVRQLFEAPLVAASPLERAELLAGAAGRVARLFGVPTPHDDAADALLDPSFAILHGLYWLCANLGRRSPLLLCVDDAHWADHASLRFLNYLGAEACGVADRGGRRGAAGPSRVRVRRCLRRSPPTGRRRSLRSHR